MTVSSLTPVNNYTGNGSVITFDFDFLIENQNELVVTHTDKNGISNLLEFGIDYSINEIGNENGSYITFPIQGSKYSVLANDEVLSLVLNLQIKQESEFANSSNLNLSILEKTFDYLVRILQILNRKIERSIKVDEGSSVTPDALIEELKEAEKNTSIYSSSCEQLTKEAKLFSENATKQANDAQKYAQETLNIRTELVQGNMFKYQIFDVITKDHLLAYDEKLNLELLGSYVYKEAIAGSRYGYPDFYNKCLEEKGDSTATDVTLGENIITMYINANGHQFFDIADKDIIDAFYETTGTAWFYGIDTTNERILLPRYDYIELSTKDRVPVVGNGTTLGLTNGSNNYGLQWHSGSVNSLRASSGAYGSSVGSSNGTGFSSDSTFGITTDSQYSGIQTDLSTYTSKKYYYMVVGNTAVESAITNIIEVTTSENDTIPLFHNFWSKEDMTTNGCYVNASLGSWLSGNIYTTAYNTLVQKLGTGNVKAVSDAYTDYDFVVNADDMTFRLPLKNGQEIMFATGVKGTGMSMGLTNGTDNFAWGRSNSNTMYANRSLLGSSVGTQMTSDAPILDDISVGLITNSEYSGIILDTENITIPEGWNLYYKVSNAVQNIELLDVAGITADLNTKISKAECPRYVVEVSDKSLLPSWYVVYNDGWCEQGGDNEVTQLVFLKEFKDTNYTIFKNVYSNSTNALSGGNSNFYDKTTTGAKTGSIKGCWFAMGYIN